MKKVLDILKNILKALKGFFGKIGGFFKNIGIAIGEFFASKFSFFGKLSKKKKTGVLRPERRTFEENNSEKEKKTKEENVEYFQSEADISAQAKTSAKKNKKTLGLVIMLTGCAVVLVLSVVMCIVNCILSYNLAEDYINEEISSGLNSYQIAVKEKTENLHLQLEAVGAKSEIYTGELDIETRKIMLKKEVKGTDYTEFSVAFPSGDTYNDTNIRKNEYFKMAMDKNKTYLSSPTHRELDDSLAIMCATKVTTTNYTGAVYGAIDYRLFSEMISTMKIGEDSSAFIIDQHGVIVAHDNDAYVRDMRTFADLALESPSSFTDVAAIAEKMLAGETAVETISYLDEECYIGYIPVGNTENWSLAIVIPAATAFTALYSSIFSNIIVLVLLIALGALLFKIVSDIISKPINIISDRLSLLAEGDIFSPIPKVKSSINETQMLLGSLSGVTTSLSSITADIDRVLGGLAEKNLTIKPETDYHGDFRSIRNSLITITNSLASIVRSLERVSDDVSNGSGQILSSSENLANSTIQQSSSLDALYTNITEISERIEANTGVTTKANNLVEATVKQANASTEKMEQMVASMGEISKTSEQIDVIIKTIDDIAFQTNILALNAAVEAAKAGEAGKGFAVVADEVRNLASRSADAASTTAKLISESIAAVHKGEEIADETAVALSEIVENINQINEFMTQIADASDEQAQRITGINESMTVISDLTQNTSATSEECAAASHEFSSHSVVLKSIVDEFKTSND